MGFFEDLGLALKGSVGNMMKNDEDDVINVKNALHRLGYRAEPAQNGIIEQETDEGIRSFQREKGLKVDGYLMPEGETENAFKTALKTLANKYKKALPYASRNLNHYLDGTGKDVVLSADDLNKQQVFKYAEQENQRRFEKSFMDDNHPFSSQLKSIRDMQTIVLKNDDGDVGDYWDYESGVGKVNYGKNPLLRRNFDEYLSTGTNKIHSNGRFRATRIGNKIALMGEVDHDWNDKYDFDPNTLDGKPMTSLEKKKLAKPYTVKGKKQKIFTGVLEYEDGTLKNPEYNWWDK